MTVSTSIDPPCTSHITVYTPTSASQTSKGSTKSKQKTAEAEADVARYCGDLAKTSLALDRVLGKPGSDA